MKEGGSPSCCGGPGKHDRDNGKDRAFGRGALVQFKVAANIRDKKFLISSGSWDETGYPKKLVGWTYKLLGADIDYNGQWRPSDSMRLHKDTRNGVKENFRQNELVPAITVEKRTLYPQHKDINRKFLDEARVQFDHDIGEEGQIFQIYSGHLDESKAGKPRKKVGWTYQMYPTFFRGSSLDRHHVVRGGHEIYDFRQNELVAAPTPEKDSVQGTDGPLLIPKAVSESKLELIPPADKARELQEVRALALADAEAAEAVHRIKCLERDLAAQAREEVEDPYDDWLRDFEAKEAARIAAEDEARIDAEDEARTAAEEAKTAEDWLRGLSSSSEEEGREGVPEQMVAQLLMNCNDDQCAEFLKMITGLDRKEWPDLVRQYESIIKGGDDVANDDTLDDTLDEFWG